MNYYTVHHSEHGTGEEAKPSGPAHELCGHQHRTEQTAAICSDRIKSRTRSCTNPHPALAILYHKKVK